MGSFVVNSTAGFHDGVQANTALQSYTFEDGAWVGWWRLAPSGRTRGVRLQRPFTPLTACPSTLCAGSNILYDKYVSPVYKGTLAVDRLGPLKTSIDDCTRLQREYLSEGIYRCAGRPPWTQDKARHASLPRAGASGPHARESVLRDAPDVVPPPPFCRLFYPRTSYTKVAKNDAGEYEEEEMDVKTSDGHEDNQLDKLCSCANPWVVNWKRDCTDALVYKANGPDWYQDNCPFNSRPNHECLGQPFACPRLP